MPQINFLDLWIILHRLHVTLGEDFALMHHGDAVGDVFDELHVMFDNNHRAVFDDFT